jgi:hypothetical protein
MTPTLCLRVIHERNSDLASLILDRINMINTIFIVLLSFPDGRAKTQCRQRRQEKPPGSNQTWVLCHTIENPEPSFYLSRAAGFFLLSFFRKLRKRKENPIDPVNPVG